MKNTRKKKVKNTVLNRLFSLALHMPPVAIVIFAWSIVARWYFTHSPALGVDLFNTATYVTYLSKNYVPRLFAWKYIWWSGHPLVGEYPTLHAYLIAPFVHYFGAVTAVQAYMLVQLLLFFLFMYLLFSEISRSRYLSSFLVVLAVFSIGTYGALVWGGSLPYFGTQTFLPLVLFLFVRFLQQKDKRSLVLSGALTGLSLFGHPQIAIVYILPAVFLLLALWSDKAIPFLSKKKIKIFALFSGLAAFVGYFEMYGRTGVSLLLLPLWIVNYMLSFFGSKLPSFVPAQITEGNVSIGVGLSATQLAILKVQHERIYLLFKEIHPAFFVMMGVLLIVALVLILISKSKKQLLRMVPYGILSLYFVFYIWLYSRGISFFHGGWYRVFWSFPLFFGMFISWEWSVVQQAVKRFVSKSPRRSILIFGSVIFIGVTIWVFIQSPRNFFENIDNLDLAYSVQSSAFPAPLNFLFREHQTDQLKEQLVPGWLEANNREFRLYEADAQVNIWWNTMFDMPVQRGYIDPPIGTERRGGYFWLDIAMKADQLVTEFEVPEDIALQNALFLLDWFGIKYIEAGHSSDSFAPLSSYLQSADLFSKEERLWYPDKKRFFSYYLDHEPVPLRAINKPQLLFVGNEPAYRATVEALRTSATNPDFVIIRGPDYIDRLSTKGLQKYDGLILYDYAYRDYSNQDQAYAVVADFLSSGKNVFIETGGGVYESDSLRGQSFASVLAKGRALPSLFPVLATEKDSFGDDWDLTVERKSFLEGVSVDQFAPPLSLSTEGSEDNAPWEVSFADEKAVDRGATVLIRNHGIPVAAEKRFGEGRIIWSGLNLGVHAEQYQNYNERLFLSNMLLSLYDFQSRMQPEYEVDSKAPGHLSVSVHGDANGIFLAQETIEGWAATIEGKDTSLIQSLEFPEPGLFIKLPAKEWKNLDVEFVYQGKQFLQYYELKDEFSSPILHPTNASVIAVVGDDNSYETFFRNLGTNNLNSKKIIPLKITDPIDSLSLDELRQFDAVVLYGYRYKNHGKAWKLLDAWVREGGKLFIETGSTVRETNIQSDSYPNAELPSVFPLSETKKDTIGDEWNLTVEDEEVFSRIDEELFGPPTIDGEPWEFSLPVSEDSLREDAEVILRHQNIPLLLKQTLGDGVVFWSGMNLPYHAMVHKSAMEGLFISEILEQLVSLESTSIPEDYSVERKSPQQASITSKPARGVLFREQVYSWNAKLDSPNKRGKLTIYKTGPTFHGYSYVFIPEEVGDDQFTVHFTYGKVTSEYFYSLLSIITMIIVVEYSILDGRMFSRRMTPIVLKGMKKVSKWWEKEDEY